MRAVRSYNYFHLTDLYGEINNFISKIGYSTSKGKSFFKWFLKFCTRRIKFCHYFLSKPATNPSEKYFVPKPKVNMNRNSQANFAWCWRDIRLPPPSSRRNHFILFQIQSTKYLLCQNYFLMYVQKNNSIILGYHKVQ